MKYDTRFLVSYALGPYRFERDVLRAHRVSLPGVRMAAEPLQSAGKAMSIGPTTIERMSAYQRSTGLKPIGLHRPAADRLLRGLSQRCLNCGGDGYHSVGKSWLWCEACGGLGRLMTPKAHFTLRRQVVERYPASSIEGLMLVVV